MLGNEAGRANELEIVRRWGRAMLWWRLGIRRSNVGLFGFLGDKSKDDEQTAEAHEFVLDTVSDADTTRRVWFKTGKHLRDQLTVEEAEQLHQEAEEKKWGWRWS